MSEGIGYDAALVSLDLALLYLRQNRTAAVKELAEEMREIFAAGGSIRVRVSRKPTPPTIAGPPANRPVRRRS